jgi:hypothetical protein
VSRKSKIPDAFLRKITDDNAADIEFYEHAREVWERRRAGVVS